MTKLTPQILAMYIGCEVKCTGGVYRANSHSINENRKPILSPSLLADFHEGTFSVQLILRRLSDMTEEEAIELCKVTQPLPFSSPTNHKWTVSRKEHGKEVFISVESKTNYYSFVIDCTDGEVMVYENSERSSGMGFAHPLIYLLSRGFDLFNLIDTSQAIEKQ